MLDTSTVKYDGKQVRSSVLPTVRPSHLSHHSQVEVSAYATTGQQNFLLLTGEQSPLWRNSYTAPWYLYDMESKDVIALAGGDKSLLNVALAPNNDLVAYVKVASSPFPLPLVPPPHRTPR